MVVILLVGGAVFASLNPAVVTRAEVINTPVGDYQVPLTSLLLIISGVALLIMLALTALSDWRAAADHRALKTRLDQYQHETAELKSRAYDEVSRKVDVFQQEVSRQFEDFRKVLKNPTVSSEVSRDAGVEKAAMGTP
jgi:hypothetical protein